MLTNLAIPRKLALSFAMIISILLAVGGMAFSSLIAIDKNIGWTVHTYEVLEKLNGIVQSMVNQETGIRGFIISGERVFLEPFENGRRQYRGYFDEVKHLTSDNPAQQRRLDELDRQVSEWRTNVAERIIALVERPESRDAGAQLERSGAGKQYMDDVRRRVAEMDKIERDLLSSRVEAMSQSSDTARTSIIGGVFAAVLLSIALVILLRRVLSAPIAEMTRAMKVLADGDTTVVVAGIDRGDEIGAMAKSVQVFKQNAIDKKRGEIEAEEALKAAKAKAEQEQRARESAIVAEVAEVARAAGEGHLERRLDLTGKEGFLLNLGEGINALISRTEMALKDVASVLSAMAEGDLTQRISTDYGGLFGQLKNDVNATSEKLGDIVGNITEAAEAIAAASAEVSTGSADLAERTEQQASSLEETAASMEELGATVRSNADSAQRANSMANDAQKAAENGGKVAGSAIEAMKRIEEASRKITDIIGVIDEIAFQTNLLALNAAVEAARAGDAGRGFAVVAQEVRQLAQRSAQASKEIKALILDSDGQVKDGVDLVKKAGGALDGIVAGVHQVATLIAEMASASTEQASTLDEINSTVAQMDEITQKNAALVEETTAAAQAMAGQADQLGQLMAFFKLDRRRQPVAAVAALRYRDHAPAQAPRAGGQPTRKPQPQPQAPARAASGKDRRSAEHPTAGRATALGGPLRRAADGADEDWKEF